LEKGRELEPVSKNELHALFPDRENVNIGGVGILGITTNLIAYRSPDNKDSSK